MIATQPDEESIDVQVKESFTELQGQGGLAALSGDRTIADLCSEFRVHQALIPYQLWPMPIPLLHLPVHMSLIRSDWCVYPIFDPIHSLFSRCTLFFSLKIASEQLFFDDIFFI